MAITLLVTDQDLTPVGDVIDGWTSLDVTRRFNEPASGTVELPASPEVAEILAEGHRLVVMRDGQVWCAGPMEVPQEWEVGWGESGQAPPGTITVHFSDDLARIAGYITWPDPAVAWSSQPAGAWRTITGQTGEQIIRTLVDENCGPGARPDRRIPSLVLGAPAGVGAVTSVNTRFEGLLEACRRVAIDGGGLGFRTRQVGDQIVFEVYAPADLSGTARFSFGLGNLRHLRAKISAPTVTHALVAGTESEFDRAFTQVVDVDQAARWYRVERFIDGSAETDDDGELTQAGREALAEGAAPVELATVTVDTPDLRAGRDFDLGDRVSIVLPSGAEVADLVRSIHLQATPTSGEYVTSLVGSAEATSDPAMVRLVRDLTRRVGRIVAR